MADQSYGYSNHDLVAEERAVLQYKNRHAVYNSHIAANTDKVEYHTMAWSGIDHKLISLIISPVRGRSAVA